MTEESRRLHNEEFHNLYSSSNVIRTIGSRKLRLVQNVARVVNVRNAYRKLKGRDRMEL
jgi:hypothetical protein